MLPKQAIKEFQQIYKRKYKVSLNFNKAEEKANNFITLMDLISYYQSEKPRSLQNMT